MSFLRVLFAAAYAIIIIAFTSCEATSDDSYYNVTIQTRIVGGKPVSLGQYQSFAFTGGSTLCGGSLIAEDIILTAAHCLKDAYAPGALIGGVTIDGSTSTPFQVVSSTPHPDYDSVSKANDIMLVKLASPSTAPIQKLNFDEMVPADGDTLTVIGFGNTAEGGTTSPDLLSVDLNVVSFADCISYWGKLDPITQLCAGYAPGGKDSCQGDSGGPIMTSSGVQVGLVSMSDGCGKANTPAIYTRLSGFSDFILKGVCDLSSNPPDSCSNPNTPVAVPVTAPVAAPVSAPLAAPVSVPVMAPAGVPLPVAAPVASPVTSPVAAPVAGYVPVQSPNAAPITSPSAAAPAAAPVTGPVLPSAAVPVTNPSMVAPVVSPSSIPAGLPATTPIMSPVTVPFVATPVATPSSGLVVPVAAPVPTPSIGNMQPAVAAPVVVPYIGPPVTAPNKISASPPAGAPVFTPVMSPLRATKPVSPLAAPIVSPAAGSPSGLVPVATPSVVVPVTAPSTAAATTPFITPVWVQPSSPASMPVTAASPASAPVSVSMPVFAASSPLPPVAPTAQASSGGILYPMSPSIPTVSPAFAPMSRPSIALSLQVNSPTLTQDLSSDVPTNICPCYVNSGRSMKKSVKTESSKESKSSAKSNKDSSDSPSTMQSFSPSPTPTSSCSCRLSAKALNSSKKSKIYGSSSKKSSKSMPGSSTPSPAPTELTISSIRQKSAGTSNKGRSGKWDYDQNSKWSYQKDDFDRGENRPSKKAQNDSQDGVVDRNNELFAWLKSLLNRDTRVDGEHLKPKYNRTDVDTKGVKQALADIEVTMRSHVFVQNSDAESNIDIRQYLKSDRSRAMKRKRKKTRNFSD